MDLFTQQDGRNADGSERSGRLIFILIWFVAVVVAGGFGFIVGVIGPKALRHIRIFGVTVFHPTPLGLALYGMCAVGVILTLLYIAVEIASRVDEHSHDP